MQKLMKEKSCELLLLALEKIGFDAGSRLGIIGNLSSYVIIELFYSEVLYMLFLEYHKQYENRIMHNIYILYNF